MAAATILTKKIKKSPVCLVVIILPNKTVEAANKAIAFTFIL